MTSKQHRIAVVIPSTMNVSDPAPADTVARWVKAAKTRFAELFGGFMVYSALGGWMSPTHGLVEEPVTIVSSNTDENGLARLGEVKALAAEMAVAMGQQAVALEVDNSLHFIPPLRLAAA